MPEERGSTAAIGRAGADDEAVPAERPARPAAIELASAILIVAGAFRLAAVALALAAPPDVAFDVPPLLVGVEVFLQLLTMTVGILVRSGRAWIVAVNVVAILAFVQLLSLGSVVSLVFGLLFGLSFVAIYLHKPWFDVTRAWRAATAREAGR